MRNSKHLTDLIFILVLFTSLSLAFYFSKNTQIPVIVVSKQESTINIDKKFWDFFHLGQKRLISSLYWVATILESDVEHYKDNDLNSWMFLRFETISILEPLFLETYTFGGPYLSIIKDDLDGAGIIYKKGLKIYPNNFSLLKNAAFHFYFEAEDYLEADKVYQALRNHPELNPVILTSFARLRSSQGDQQDAFNILLEVYKQLKVKDDFLAKKIYLQLYAVKAEMDLNCLNQTSKNKKCDLKDFGGNLYNINSDGKFSAKYSWIPYRIKGKKKK